MGFFQVWIGQNSILTRLCDYLDPLRWGSHQLWSWMVLHYSREDWYTTWGGGSYCLKSKWQLWPGGPLHRFILCANFTLSSTRKSLSRSWRSQNWTTILQWILQMAALEDHPEATSVPKHSGGNCNGNISCLVPLLTMQAALTANWLLNEIQGDHT